MATFTGTSGVDVINGTAGDDTIEGLAGSDQLYGLDGNDILRGGDEYDYLSGGEGDDLLEGGGGDDGLVDSFGDDVMDGGEGNDWISSAYGGDDVILGGVGNDSITVDHVQSGDHIEVDAGAGNDTLYLYDFWANEHVINMGTGDDRIQLTVVKGAPQITLGEGRDIVELHEYFAGTVGGTAHIVITDFAAGDAGDRVEFLELIPRLFSNWNQALSPFATGHARLIQSGADALLQFDVNGGGDNFVTVLTFANVSSAAFTAYNLDGFPSDGSIPAGLSLTGTSERDVLKGAAGGDTIDGLDGDDWLRGGAGNDVMQGGAGSDQIDGQIGDDEIYGGDDRDLLDGGYGADLVNGEGGNDNITSIRGEDVLDGGAGDDYIYINRGSLTVETVVAFGGDGNDQFSLYAWTSSTFHIDAGDGDDVVNVELMAGLGNISLGAGADTLVLSRYYADYLADLGSLVVSDFDPAEGDKVDLGDFIAMAFPSWDGASNPFGAGFMRLVQSGGDSLLQIDRSGGNGNWRTIVTFQGIDPASFTATSLGDYAPDGTPPVGLVIEGTAYPDSLKGGGGSDEIDGLAGSDFIQGMAGADLIRGGDGGDTLHGGPGDDFVEGGDGNDYMTGNAGDDILFGGAGDDHFFDETGSDFVHAGAGDDYVTLQRTNSFGDEIAVFAEEGNDFLSVNTYGTTYATVDMGVGDDVVELGPLYGTLDLTLGEGFDTVRLAGFGFSFTGGDIRIADFTLGEDFIDLDDYLSAYLQGWDEASNPFATGFARLVQSGSDTLLQIDRDGSGAGSGFWTWLTIAGLLPHQFGVSSLGYAIPPGVYGGDGDETFTFTSPAALAGVPVDGGGGTDRLVLNGAFGGGIAFAAGTFLNMERIELVSAPQGQLNGYDITIADGNLGAGGLLTVLAADLRAGENLVFHGEGVTNARFAITSGAGADTLMGGSGADALDGGGGIDILRGNGGDDVLNGGAGADDMAGGAGNDHYYVDDAGDAVTEAAGGGTDEIHALLGAYSLMGSQIENLSAASDIAHDLRGNAGNNVITGGAGNDVLRLYDGGNDQALAGAGNDNIFFGAALTVGDLVNGGTGVDTLVIQGNYSGGLTLGVNVTQIENVSILGGNNTSFGEPGTNRYDYVLTTRDQNFAAGVQARINGAALLAGEDFTFNGSAETNASFVVYGGKGKDTLTGGLGNDIFFYAEERFATGDTVNGGAGYDGMFLRGNYTIDFNAPGYTGLFTNIENLTLTSATDERYARGGGTEFDYNLTLSDAIVGAGQTLTISGALLMATETMILDGSHETNGLLRLFGGRAADTLKGGANADLIHGNLGADILAGNGGSDAFRYQDVQESYSVATDHIIDFTPGTDRIELDRIDADIFTGGDQAFTWIGSNAFSNVAGQLRAYDNNGTWMVEGDINGDGYADLIIALTLQGPTPLGAGDFVL